MPFEKSKMRRMAKQTVIYNNKYRVHAAVVRVDRGYNMTLRPACRIKIT